VGGGQREDAILTEQIQLSNSQSWGRGGGGVEKKTGGRRSRNSHSNLSDSRKPSGTLLSPG
jgi:hypothetical protein